MVDYNKLSDSVSTNTDTTIAVESKTKGQLQSQATTTEQKLAQIQNDVNHINNVMRDNLGKVIERGEKIEETCRKTKELEKDAERFRIGAQKLRRKQRIENAKRCALIIFIASIVITMASLLIYYESKD